MSLEDARNLATIAGVLIGVLAFLKGVREYGEQGRQKRAEHFMAMRQRFKENASFIELCDFLEDDNARLAEMPFKKKRDFLGFFEEIAIMCNSGLLRVEVAHYMFGYYVIDCWNSDHFWKGVERDANYLALFRDFALQMVAMEKHFRFQRRRLRL